MLFVPPCYAHEKSIPLVFNLHGGGGTAEAAEIGIGGLHKKAAAECFIAVHPNAVSIKGLPGKRQHWNSGPREHEFRNPNIDDVSFIRAVLELVKQDYNIDRRQVFVTGISNGAQMAYRLACEMSDEIAAIAPVGSGMLLQNCSPAAPVSILHLHGTVDPGWPPAGGAGCFTRDIFPPISVSIEAWRSFDHCGPNNEVKLGGAACRRSACAADIEVVLCLVPDGGHTWPGGYTFPVERALKWDSDCELGQGRGVGQISPTVKGIDLIWSFFQSHPKQSPPRMP